MTPRIDNPALQFPRTVKALAMLHQPAEQEGIPHATSLLVVTRVSQINGCGVCLDMHTRELRHAGESDARIDNLATWREAPYYDDAERAALALAEAATRLADRPDPVSDAVWDEAARHFSQAQLAALVLVIAGINAWNRINATTRQRGGDWVEQLIQAPA